jgi:hypothetical protein
MHCESLSNGLGGPLSAEGRRLSPMHFFAFSRNVAVPKLPAQTHRIITGGMGCNLLQEAARTSIDAVQVADRTPSWPSPAGR